MNKKSRLETFLQALSTDGGNILVLLFIILLLAVFEYLKFPDARQQLYFVIGALVGVLRGKLTAADEKEEESDE